MQYQQRRLLSLSIQGLKEKMDKEANIFLHLFTLTPSINEENHVVEFHSKEAFDERADKLIVI